MGISKATAEWNGTLKAGNGVMKPAHASDIGFSLGTRFEGQPGSNPEEVIGAALAGCFSMALSLGIEKAGGTPKSIKTTADVKLDKDGEGFAISSIALKTAVQASGLSEAQFQQVAQATKQGCPVSKALQSVPELTLEATLTNA